MMVAGANAMIDLDERLFPKVIYPRAAAHSTFKGRLMLWFFTDLKTLGHARLPFWAWLRFILTSRSGRKS